MLQHVSRILEDCFTASAKSLVIAVSAVRKRLPKLCPLRSESAWKRCWKRRESKASSFREGGDAVANVTGRKDLEVPTQLPTGAAIVGYGDYRLELSAVHPRYRRLHVMAMGGGTGLANLLKGLKKYVRNPNPGISALEPVVF